MWTWDTTHVLNSAKEVAHYWQIAHFGGPLQLNTPKEEAAMVASLGMAPSNGADQGRYDGALFYDDNW